MFRISRRLDYGLQLMIALAQEPDNHPQSTASLAEKLQMPLPFLHQIAHTLMQAGLIKASPGPRGGLRLSRPAENITALHITESLEGPITLNPCSDLEDDCPRQDKCSTDSLWTEIQDRIVRQLESVRLDVLVNQPSNVPVLAMSFSQNAYGSSD
ncbi:MAG: Rrf2 family transcriptional regulator [Anaerolineaceae bacterium]|nr:Rrf2 family transcriptional regulator [Anaerolineaceae bacterium]